jgi:hypothetical protein
MDKKQMESLYYYLVSLYHAYIIKLQNFLFEKLPTNTIIDFEDGFGLYIDSKKMLYHIRIIQLDKNIMKNFEFEDCEVVDQKNSILFKKVNCCNLKNIYDVKSNTKKIFILDEYDEDDIWYALEEIAKYNNLPEYSHPVIEDLKLYLYVGGFEFVIYLDCDYDKTIDHIIYMTENIRKWCGYNTLL